MGCICGKEDKEQKGLQLLRIELADNIPIYAKMSSSRNVDLKLRLASYRLCDFTHCKRIGSGRYGIVNLVTEKGEGQRLAMKEVLRKHEVYAMEPYLELEHRIMCQMKGPWLMEMIQCFETPTKLCMLLELLPGPNLVKVAKEKVTSEKLLKGYISQMLMAVQTVHHYGYMHRDVKLSNFLLDTYGHVKLIDFGTCIRFLPYETAKTVFPIHGNFCVMPPEETLQYRRNLLKQYLTYQPLVPHGSTYYCAPEVIRLATLRPTIIPYTYLCDYWSLGVCIYYLLYSQLPFYDDEKIRLPSLILNWPRTLEFKKSKMFGPAAVDLIRGLLRDEDTRLGRNGIYDLASHQFFQPNDWTTVDEINNYYWRSLNTGSAVNAGSLITSSSLKGGETSGKSLSVISHIHHLSQFPNRGSSNLSGFSAITMERVPSNTVNVGGVHDGGTAAEDSGVVLSVSKGNFGPGDSGGSKVVSEAVGEAASAACSKPGGKLGSMLGSKAGSKAVSKGSGRADSPVDGIETSTVGSLGGSRAGRRPGSRRGTESGTEWLQMRGAALTKRGTLDSDKWIDLVSKIAVSRGGSHRGSATSGKEIDRHRKSARAASTGNAERGKGKARISIENDDRRRNRAWSSIDHARSGRGKARASVGSVDTGNFSRANEEQVVRGRGKTRASVANVDTGNFSRACEEQVVRGRGKARASVANVDTGNFSRASEEQVETGRSSASSSVANVDTGNFSRANEEQVVRGRGKARASVGNVDMGNFSRTNEEQVETGRGRARDSVRDVKGKMETK